MDRSVGPGFIDQRIESSAGNWQAVAEAVGARHQDFPRSLLAQDVAFNKAVWGNNIAADRLGFPQLNSLGIAYSLIPGANPIFQMMCVFGSLLCHFKQRPKRFLPAGMSNIEIGRFNCLEINELQSLYPCSLGTGCAFYQSSLTKQSEEMRFPEKNSWPF